MEKVSGLRGYPENYRSKRTFSLRAKPRRTMLAGGDLLKNAAFYGLLSVILLAVALFGTVDDWAESLIVFLICLAACFRAADYLTSREKTFFRTGTAVLMLPPVGVLLLATAQIIPLGGDTISADVYVTKRFIVLGAALLLAFDVLLRYATTRGRLKALCATVIAAGVGSALFGVWREFASGQEDSFWAAFFEPGTGFAQFINRNHFVYVIEMSLGLLCGLTLKGALNEKQKFAAWVVSGLLILTAIAVNSRGGLLSIAGLFVLAFVIHFLTKGRRRHHRSETGDGAPLWLTISKAAAVGVVVFGISVFTVAFVGGDQVVSRIERIDGEVVAAETQSLQRANIWRSTKRLIAENPVAGAGFGAYGAAITRFDDSGGKFSLRQAHNDYLELAASGGIVAVVLVIAFGFLLARRTSARLSSEDGFYRGSAFGAMLGIIGVLIHSIVDFGLHAVGVALIFLVLTVIAAAPVENFDE